MICDKSKLDDRIVTVYVLENGSYGKAGMQELIGTSISVIMPAITIDWALEKG